MSVIDEVKQKTDIVDVIGQRVPLTKAGRNFRALCPFHSERAPSFYVFPERQSWHCFGACNTGGDVFSFVMRQEGLDFGEALRLLAQQAGVAIPSRREPDTRKDERDRLYQVNEAAAAYFHDQLLSSPAAAKARDYLVRRGFTTETITAFQLGYAPGQRDALKQHLVERGYTEKELLDAGLLVKPEDGEARDRFRDRLMFPISDARGRTTGFGARVLDESLPKYTNSPQTLVFDKSGTLYGLDLAAPVIRKQDRAVLVEGYMDAITAHQNGFKDVVAVMGTSVTHSEEDKDIWRAYNEPTARTARRTGTERPKELSDKQLNALRRLTRNITLALDADAAGKEAMLRCVDYENTLDAEVRVIVLPAGRDPDDVIREDAGAWQSLVEDAVPVLDYAFDMITSGLDLTEARGKSRASSEILPLIARTKDDVRRDHYLTKLANLSGIRYNVLETALKGHVTGRAPRKAVGGTTVAQTAPFLSRPVEEECLCLLLQHPELKDRTEQLLPEYFQNSQNREILMAWRESHDLESLRERLDPTMWEQVDSLASREVVGRRFEEKLARIILRMKKEHLRDLKTLEAAALREAPASGDETDAARLTEDGIEANAQLLEIFRQEARANRSARDESGRVP